MDPPLLGLILDSSVIIAAERKRQTVEELLASVGRTFGEIEIAISAVTLAELVHGVARANTPQVRESRRAFIDELKRHTRCTPSRTVRPKSQVNSVESRPPRASRSRPMTC